MNYVSNFFPKVQEILRPLHRLGRKRKDFKWTAEHQEAFETIKELMTKPPILHMPKKEGRFTLYSDTLRNATGSYLTQKCEGHERIIGYYSKVLPEACKRYSVTELEMLGLLINITAFKYLLSHCEFDAVVDHSALVQLMKSKQEPPTARLRELLSRLSDYAVCVRYQKGSDIPFADFLSRAPKDDDSEIDQVVPVTFSMLSELNDPPYPSNEESINPVMTRSKARALGIKVPDLFSPQNNRSTRNTPASNSPSRPVRPTSQNVS